MHILEYTQFTQILNENILESPKPDLLDKISKIKQVYRFI